MHRHDTARVRRTRVHQRCTGKKEMPDAAGRHRPRPVVGALLGLALVAGSWTSVWAQEEPVARFEGLAEVREVLLDVLAVDAKGETVLGLGAKDFIVEEDGQPMEVSGVSFYASRYGLDDGILEADGVVPSSRYFIFYIHSPIGGSVESYLVRQQVRLREDLLDWVEESLLPSDWVAVAGYDVRLKIHQDFTQDRLAMADGIRSAIGRRNPDQGIGRRGRPLPPSGAPSLRRHLPSGKALSRQSRNPYDGTRLLAEAAGYIVGRKNLVLFSPGLGGLESLNFSAVPNPRDYRPMEQALNDHNVAVYSVDLTPIEVRHLQGQLLPAIALATGGAYFRDPIDFKTPLQRISRENVGYYLISYQSEHPIAEGGYQEVKVRAKDKRIKLRARKGYRFGRP